jgi:branched-chain amino acid transport system permease protein
MTGSSMRTWIACVAALVALITAPFWIGNSYYLNVGSQILFWAIFAQALNILVGYAGLTSLGHAALFSMSGYAAAIMLTNGASHLSAAVVGLVMTLIVSAVFAVLALRATGIGFLMITLAMGQIIWGIAYRWSSLTNGDNGINIKDRPMPFGLDLADTSTFYWVTLAVFLLAMLNMAVFVRSPLGAAVRGTRDQARRMTALGYNVWLIRFVAFLMSGFWTGVAGLLFLYYNQFISPQIAALQTSAEALLMVISGGTATVLGPIAGAAIVIIMKNVVSAYVERWNMVLGIIFVLIVSFVPEGIIPGMVRLVKSAFGSKRREPTRDESTPGQLSQNPLTPATSPAAVHATSPAKSGDPA